MGGLTLCLRKLPDTVALTPDELTEHGQPSVGDVCTFCLRGKLPRPNPSHAKRVRERRAIFQASAWLWFWDAAGQPGDWNALSFDLFPGDRE